MLLVEIEGFGDEVLLLEERCQVQGWIRLSVVDSQLLSKRVVGFQMRLRVVDSVDYHLSFSDLGVRLHLLAFGFLKFEYPFPKFKNIKIIPLIFPKCLRDYSVNCWFPNTEPSTEYLSHTHSSSGTRDPSCGRCCLWPPPRRPSLRPWGIYRSTRSPTGCPSVLQTRKRTRSCGTVRSAHERSSMRFAPDLLSGTKRMGKEV